eukprot:CAMPEP_0181249662 /NCGR_PEP_ID=MMETSP1096-20121128/45885_1 /TAXON_ID=156174 ORGANISM="Chrysochromulina ericina, Strain CCMP281" /NCGR_SAMPLE_ID=MMETSP1096 /ASSEMBLY_ACC=CAM_ASM_000453 /LENGTH=130 /DNA_ID=CAMNT_0023347037 /DNA_START=90 /DNA_END=480 /DNA_ORIENTATION=+
MACTVHTAQHAARHDTRQGHKERAHGWSTSPTKSLLPRPGRKAGRGNGRVAQVNETVEVAWRTLVENHVTQALMAWRTDPHPQVHVAQAATWHVTWPPKPSHGAYSGSEVSMGLGELLLALEGVLLPDWL